MPFNGQMLTLARQLKKFSQTDLLAASSKQISQAMLSKIERGRVQPEEDLVASLSAALGVRPSFFFHGSYLRQPPMSYHRKRKKLSAKDLQAVHAASEVIRISLEKCLDEIELENDGPSLPAFDLDQFDGDAGEAARIVRTRLKLPRGPVRNLSRTLESTGVIIAPFNFGSPLIDGFCQHSHGGLPSMVFLNTLLPVDRVRFSLAHEMGHLVCHDSPNPEQETQANQFASEFLMPTADIYDDLREMSLSKAMELKLYWGTSMQSIVQKAWSTGRISDARRKNLFIEFSRRGWRTKEPVEAVGFIEEPKTFSEILAVLSNGLGYSANDFSEYFGISHEDLRLYYPIARTKPTLRVVASN